MLSSVFVMLGGGVVSQLISVITALIVARLYSVSVVGEYSIFLMCATILSSIVFLRLELSLGHTDVDDISYTRAVIKKVSYFTFPVILCLVFAVSLLFDFFNSIINVLILIVAIYIISAYRLMYYAKCFSNIFISLAKLKVKLALLLLVMSSTFGYIDAAIYSLILSFILSHALLVIVNRNNGSHDVNLSSVKSYLYKKKDFLAKMTVGSVMGLVSSYMIMFVVSFRFGVEVVGYYAVAEKMFRAPLGVIQASLADVLRVKLDGLRNKNIAWKFLFLSCFSALGFVTFIYYVSPILINYLLGDKWAYVENIVIYLLPLSFFQMILQPLLPLFQQGKKSSFEMTFNFFFIISVLLCGIYFSSSEDVFFVSLLFFLVPLYLISLFYLIFFIYKK